MKTVTCEVVLLDQQTIHIDVAKNANGCVLLNEVLKFLSITENDYFGLILDDLPRKSWLDPNKLIKEQFVKDHPWIFQFSVKFFPKDPDKLFDDTARHFIALALRNKVSNEKCPCPLILKNVIRNASLENEKSFLEVAKKLPLYGNDKHYLKVQNKERDFVGVSWSGIVVCRNSEIVNEFQWGHIYKLSFSRDKFIITTSDSNDGVRKYDFKLPSCYEAKSLWKSSVEHHSFFRLKEPYEVTHSCIMKMGSKFCYSGRTLAQLHSIVYQQSNSVNEETHQFAEKEDVVEDREKSCFPSTFTDGDAFLPYDCSLTDSIDDHQLDELQMHSYHPYDDSDRYSEPPILEMSEHQQAMQRLKCMNVSLRRDRFGLGQLDVNTLF